MSNVPEPSFWQQIGVSVQELVAGFSGGVVKAFIFDKGDPKAIVASVIVGTLTANYLSPMIGHYVGTTAGVAGFLTGLAAMVICQRVVNAFSTWQPFQPKG